MMFCDPAKHAAAGFPGTPQSGADRKWAAGNRALSSWIRFVDKPTGVMHNN